MTNESTHRFSGDVTLAGGEAPPVAVHGPADSFVRPAGVEGDLDVKNAEYVFTGVAPDGTPGSWAPETDIRGDVEDGYVTPGGVDGDLRIAGAEDVFVASGAVGGDLRVSGAENVFEVSDTDAGPDADRAEFDLDLAGWEQSGRVEDPEVGVALVGAQGEIAVEKTRHDIAVYVVGHHNEVTVEGRRADVTVHFVGYENEVRLGPYLSGTVGSEAGFDNAVEEAPYPAEELIETTRSEAFSNVGFGRRKVTFQRPADEEWCGNCGEPADAVIERLQMEAFFVFGHPLKTYERSTTPAQECEHCSPNAVEATLTEAERRDVLE